MAIYHFHAQIIGRSDNRSAVAAAAYRSGERLYDKEKCRSFQWSRDDVQHVEVMLPEGAPETLRDRETLWNEVHRLEKRKDAQLAREIDLALPRELNDDARLDLLRSYVQDKFVDEGMVADIAIHNDDESHNPHAHIMLTLRQAGEWGFKSTKTRWWNSKSTLEDWRAEWSVYANKALEQGGHSERIDHRTLEEQGIDREATIHEGPAAREIAGKSLFAPSSRRKEIVGWQRKGRVVDYTHIDQGRSRVAYNRSLSLRQAERFQRSQANKVLKDPSLDYAPANTPAFRENAAKLAEASKVAFGKRAAYENAQERMIAAKQELRDFEKYTRKLPPYMRKRYMGWLVIKWQRLRKLARYLVEHETRAYVAETRVTHLQSERQDLVRAETRRRQANDKLRQTYIAKVHQNARSNPDALWRSRLSFEEMQQIKSSLQGLWEHDRQMQVRQRRLERIPDED